MTLIMYTYYTFHILKKRHIIFNSDQHSHSIQFHFPHLYLLFLSETYNQSSCSRETLFSQRAIKFQQSANETVLSIRVASPAGQHIQCGLFATVPGRSIDQAAAPGLHYSHPAVDVRPVVQGAALRLSADRHAVLHLCHHRHAGMSNHNC